jgi:hypothetical protein
MSEVNLKTWLYNAGVGNLVYADMLYKYPVYLHGAIWQRNGDIITERHWEAKRLPV